MNHVMDSGIFVGEGMIRITTDEDVGTGRLSVNAERMFTIEKRNFKVKEINLGSAYL